MNPHLPAAFGRLAAWRLCLLLFFLWWGWRIVVNDLRFKKVPNKGIASGLKAAGLFLLLYAAETALGAAGVSSDYVRWTFYPLYAVNLLLSAVMGVLLWYAEVWPAGDAKFFITCLAMLPLIDFGVRGFPKVLWLSVMLNSFMFASVFYLLKFVAGIVSAYRNRDGRLIARYEGIKKDVGARLEGVRARGARGLALGGTALFFLFFVQQTARSALQGDLQRLVPDLTMLYFLMFIGWDKVSRYLSGRWSRLAMAVVAPLYLAFGFAHFGPAMLFHLRRAAVNVIGFGFILGAGRFALVYLMDKFSMTEVSADELAPGMVLSSRYVDIIRRDPYFADSFSDSFRDGISPEETELLRNWVKRIPGGDPKIEVMEGYPFAVWIFLGCVFQLAFNGNVLTVAGELLRR